MKPSLRVLTGGQLGRETTLASLPTLEAQPFRSGEVPQLLVVDLEQEVSERVEAEAAGAGLPRELWLRVSVEAARLLRRATGVLGLEWNEVIRLVEERRPAPYVTTIEARRHDSYARQIRDRVAPRRPRAAISRMSIPVPETMLAAWSIDAASEALTLTEFVNARALEAPRVALSWEAASAERGQSLGEWIYEALLGVTRRR